MHEATVAAAAARWYRKPLTAECGAYMKDHVSTNDLRTYFGYILYFRLRQVFWVGNLVWTGTIFAASHALDCPVSPSREMTVFAHKAEISFSRCAVTVNSLEALIPVWKQFIWFDARPRHGGATHFSPACCTQLLHKTIFSNYVYHIQPQSDHCHDKMI